MENNRNLIDSVANSWDTTTISQFDYTNDKAGRRTAREDSGTAFASTQNNTFDYNDRSEVIEATMRNGNSTYNFDQIGNRRSAAVPAAVSSPGGTFEYLANALNQYSSVPSVPSVPSVVNPIHDDDGNLVDDGKGTTFEWNAENRMNRVHTGDKTIENTYDGQGRRVRKLVKEFGNPIEDHRYFYDGWNLVYEYDVLDTQDTKYYVWGLDLSQTHQGAGGVGGLLLVRQGENAWAPTYDANGNISEYINLDDGTITAHLEYDAFGRIIVTTGTAPSNFGFSTKYEDTETGYLYYGFRYYDPQTGRWPNRDPIEERGGYNLYAFVGNSTINGFDLFGLRYDRNPLPRPPEPMSYEELLNLYSLIYGSINEDIVSEVHRSFRRRYLQAMAHWTNDRYFSSAGPDITTALFSTIHNFTETFLGSTTSEICQFCMDLKFALWKLLNGWDIMPLYTLGFGSYSFTEGTRGRFRGADTVVLNLGLGPRAYNAGSVNYMLWGRMHRMCYEVRNKLPWVLRVKPESSWYVMASSRAWGHKTIINHFFLNAIGFITNDPTLYSGYRRWDEAKAFTRMGFYAALPGNVHYTGLRIDDNNRISNVVFEWRALEMSGP